MIVSLPRRPRRFDRGTIDKGRDLVEDAVDFACCWGSSEEDMGSMESLDERVWIDSCFLESSSLMPKTSSG